MALTVGRTPATDTADDAIQVVDLDDIVTGSIDDQLLPPVHMRRRRRLVPPGIARPAKLAGAVGLVLVVPVVATVLYMQRDSGSRVDTEDGRQPPTELPLPGRDPEVPDGIDDSLQDRSTGVAPAATAPTPPLTASVASTTTAPTTTTVPPTTASTATTTPSPTLPDGSPNPLGPGPDGPSSGPTTTMPGPYDSDVIPGG